MVNGQKVVKGQRLTAEQCNQIDAAEQKKALDWVDRNVKVTLTEPQKVGIASFCPWNIGPGKCFTSTFTKVERRRPHWRLPRNPPLDIRRWPRLPHPLE